MGVDRPSHRNDFWIERAASATRMDVLGRWVARLSARTEPDEEKRYGPYLLVLVVTLFDVFVLPIVGYLQTGTYFPLSNPAEFAIPPAWILVVWSILRLKTRYEETIEKLPASTDVDQVPTESHGIVQPILERVVATTGGVSTNNQGTSRAIFPIRWKFGLLVLAWVYHFGWILTDPGAGQYVTDNAGPLVALTKFGLVYPIVYYPIGVEFVSIFLTIHVLLPFNVTRENLVDFQDPRGYGGLRPVGELSKNSAVLYLFLLSLYVGFLSFAKGVTTTQLIHATFIVGGTIAGAVLFFLPIVWVGFYMQSMKQTKIDAIVAETEELGRDERALPDARVESSEEATRYAHQYARLSFVKDMHDYPADIFTIRDFVYALPVPLVVNILATYLANTVLGL